MKSLRYEWVLIWVFVIMPVHADMLTCQTAAATLEASPASSLFAVRAQTAPLADYSLVEQDSFWQIYRDDGAAFTHCQPQNFAGVIGFPVIKVSTLGQVHYEVLLQTLKVTVSENFDITRLTSQGYQVQEPDRLNQLTITIDGDLDTAIDTIKSVLGVLDVQAMSTRRMVYGY